MKTPTQTSLSKALKIIECFSSETPSLRLSDIAPRVKLHPSTAYRLLTELVAEGFIEFEPATKEYQLGVKFLSFASVVLRRLDIIEISKPAMKRLVKKTQQTVNVAILDRGEVVYIAKEEPPSSLRLSSRVGARVPAYCTALGKVLMAYLPNEEQKQIFSNLKFKKYTEATISNKADLKKELASVRKEGFGIDREEFLPGLICVAFPIFDFNENVIASISISGPVTDFKEKRLKNWEKDIGEAAAQISARFGRPVTMRRHNENNLE